MLMAFEIVLMFVLFISALGVMGTKGKSERLHLLSLALASTAALMTIFVFGL
ncbi:hypothetical protein [Priestia aryabhattai]|uniref:hypothetical protein n=1 Tax=Priestia aryabhattai TaxID=412384 RepID=UPI003C9A4196